METTQIIGYRVKVNTGYGYFVNQYGSEGAVVDPCTQAEAYRRVSEYLTRNPNAAVPEIVPVTRPLTPLETASRELGGQLESLCRRHGLNLGLNRQQIESRIAKELAELGAGGAVASVINGLMGR